MKATTKWGWTAICSLIYLLGLWWCSDHVFFWDTIQLGSKHAHWYYENDFKYFLLPPEIDSGHPPLFGMLLALCWSFFGKSLLVSHLMMWPIVLATIWQVIDLAEYYGQKWLIPVSLLILVDPVLSSHLLLISPDALVACFFLLGWRAILYQKTSWKIFGMIILGLISTRGMMTVFALFLFEAYLRMIDREAPLSLSFKSLLRIIWPYIPAGLLASGFLLYHYYETGWVGYHADSPWAWHFKRMGLSDMPKQIAILFWRMFDFGRIFLLIPFLLAFPLFGGQARQMLRRSYWRSLSAKNRQLWVLLLALGLCLLPTFLLYRGLNSHRYMLPFLLVLSYLTAYQIIHLLERKTLWLSLVIIGLATGNFWVYPDKIAQAWDNSLARLPYFHLRKQMHTYLASEGIPLEKVGTEFPEIGPLKYKDLSNRTNGFVKKDLQNQTYILYSNLMNDFSDQEIDSLQSNWSVKKALHSGGVKLFLYEKK